MSLELVEGAGRLPCPPVFASRPRTPTEMEALDFIARAVRGMETDVRDYMGALVAKHSRQDYDFKEIRRTLQAHGEMLKGFAKRIRELEKTRGSTTTSDHPGRGHWRLPLKREPRSNSPVPGVEGNRTEQGQREDLAEYEGRPRPAIGPVPDYSAIRAEAAEKAGRELPETISVTDLARYFGVSRCTVWRIATRGELAAVRRGRAFAFPRGEVVQYIRSRGVPRPQGVRYGVSGIRVITDGAVGSS